MKHITETCNILSFVMKLYLKYTVFSSLIMFGFILGWHLFVSMYSSSYLYSETDTIEGNKVGLLLGTSHKVKGGSTNYYYANRINAALELYHNGKITKIICSGDNGTRSYNEPIQMQKDLIKGGVPIENIILDYAGFRTLDSVIRAKEIFGQNRMTIISQKFHTERAVFIARSKGIDAIGYNAADVNDSSKWKLMLREKLARTKMALDLIFNKQPKFLGQAITIP